MAPSEEVRIEIGLEGGQGVEITTAREQWQRLESALGGADALATVEGRDGAEYRIALSKIRYMRVQSVTRSVGFREI